MKINWFPGHMKKNLDMMKKEVQDIDVVIYMLDARAPLSCINPSFVNVIKNKPIIYVLNKVDLVDKDNLSFFVQKLSKNNTQVILLNATLNSAKTKIISAIENAMKVKLEAFRQKGARLTIKSMVIGVPNCGKSTLCNTLAGKSKAITGDRAGVTKSKQWIKVSPYVEVLDTPGTLWPNLKYVNVAENLAFIGSIKSEVLDNEQLCIMLIKRLMQIDADSLNAKYNITISSEDSAVDVIEKIALSKGLKIKGGEPDFDRTYALILNDYKKGKITNKILDEVK